jgi:O-methyltransferase involved in polyketide biosynthesis
MAEAGDSGRRAASLDISVPHLARVYNYWLGGKDNFAADRAVADQVIVSYPDVVFGVRAQRMFLRQAVRYLVAEAGIRQFLDIGTGLPSADNTHEVAQREAPESRIVYVDNDPIVLSHARALLTTSPEGATEYIDADLRDPEWILSEAANLLDFSKPAAIVLLGILHSIPDKDDPYGIVARLLAAVPSGSYLVISHVANDVDDQATRTMRDYNQGPSDPVIPRSHAEVSAFLDGLDLVEPGLVQIHRWRPTSDPDRDRDVPNYAAVGRKP